MHLASKPQPNRILNLKSIPPHAKTPCPSSKHIEAQKLLILRNAASNPKNVVVQGETSRWIFKRKLSHQLGYIQELKKRKAENEVRLLFQLWDFDESGTLEPDEILRGLIKIGLGADLNFTKEVILNAFNGNGENEGESTFKLSFDDFKKLLMIEPKLKKIARALHDYAIKNFNRESTPKRLNKARSTARLNPKANVFISQQP